MEVTLNGGEFIFTPFLFFFLFFFLGLGLDLTYVQLTVNSNVDNLKTSWRITLLINGLLKVCLVLVKFKSVVVYF